MVEHFLYRLVQIFPFVHFDAGNPKTFCDHDKIRIDQSGEETEVKCIVKNFRFTSHAKRESLLEIVKKLKPENVILVHGEAASINWVGENILKHNKKIKVFSAEIGKEINMNKAY